jgi:hypothetical protein
MRRMKEYRLTFATENFGAISQALVDMGISFHVEPIEAAGRAPADASDAQLRGAARKSAKAPARKKPSRSARHGDDSPVAGAQRQLERWSRGEREAGPLGAPPPKETTQPTTEASPEVRREDQAPESDTI